MSRIILNGVVHGKVIELDQPSNLPDGQHVTIVVQPANGSKPASGEGLRRSAGMWADDSTGLDQHLDSCRRQRKNGRRGIDP